MTENGGFGFNIFENFSPEKFGTIKSTVWQRFQQINQYH
jgi:hypothetical protein